MQLRNKNPKSYGIINKKVYCVACLRFLFSANKFKIKLLCFNVSTCTKALLLFYAGCFEMTWALLYILSF